MSHRAIAASILTIPTLILGAGCSGGKEVLLLRHRRHPPGTRQWRARGADRIHRSVHRVRPAVQQPGTGSRRARAGAAATTAKVTRGPGHCSSTAYLVSVDGGEAASTEFHLLCGGSSRVYPTP